MSQTSNNSRGGQYATSPRAKVSENFDFIQSQHAKGIPVSAIARMIGCNVVDVALCLDPASRPKREVIAQRPAPLPRKEVASVRQHGMADWARQIVERHAARAGATFQEFIGKGKLKTLAAARAACWADLYASGRCSLPLVGLWFARDHSSILHAIVQHSRAQIEQVAA